METCDFLTVRPRTYLNRQATRAATVLGGACGGVLWCPRMVPILATVWLRKWQSRRHRGLVQNPPTIQPHKVPIPVSY
jgi:hypothetical protein